VNGNTGVAGGTYGADPVPAKQDTAPDGSTVVGTPEGQPQPELGEQNTDYPNGDERGVADDGGAVG
jgi:hypothetical protein